MRKIMENDPLLAGFFSIKEAARLLDVSRQQLRGWLDGYTNSQSGPVIDRDFSDTQTISFLDLMELRFIAIFRAQGVSMRTLRQAADKARREWETSHPLALSTAKYTTDRRDIFAQSAKESGDPTETDGQATWDAITGQFVMWETIEQTIEKGVSFDPVTFLAREWHPMFEKYPGIIVNPHIAFGQPTVKGTKVPTSVLFRQWQAEEENRERVAEWFDVKGNDVDTAINFELELAAA